MSRHTHTALRTRRSDGVFLFTRAFAFAKTKTRTLRITRWERLSLHHPSLRFPTATMIAGSISRSSSGGRVPTQALGLNLRPQNDSGRPACERLGAACTAG